MVIVIGFFLTKKCVDQINESKKSIASVTLSETEHPFLLPLMCLRIYTYVGRIEHSYTYIV